jgi:hypothetical protein
LKEIDPIAGAAVYTKLTDALADWFDVSEVAE